MKLRIGRNDPCWCKAIYPDGKRKKYKDCHLERDKQPRVRMDEILGGLKSSFGKRYCLHASAGTDCSGDIIKAHTIQRNGGLSRIAQNGKVYTFDPGTATLVKTGHLSARLIGVGLASTFTGFCGRHDDTAFEPVEKHPFIGTEEQIFLLAYRAICRELFYKRGHLEDVQHLRNMDRGGAMMKQISLQAMTNQLEEGVKAGLGELDHHKAIFDDALLRRDFSGVRYYLIETDKAPDIVTSGGFQPEYGFQGQILQNLAETSYILDHITLNILPTDTGGIVLLSWMGDLKACELLAKSLDSVSDDALPDAVLRLAVEHLENTYMAPVWWDQLPSKIKEDLTKRAHSGIWPVGDTRGSHSLVDDGVRIASWSALSRHTNAI